jgi:hypothetical protein
MRTTTCSGQGRSSFGAFILSLIAAAICLWPVWLWLLAKSLLSPHGFWQEFFLLGVGVWFLGGAQVVFLIILIIVLFFIWADR